MKELIEIQTRIKVKKSRQALNRNGGVLYTYRNLEDIQEAVKPLLKELKCTLKLTDSIELIGNRFYLKATATLTNEAGESESTTAYAREPDTLGVMTAPQVTGSSSSYARKYALNGLLGLDDAKDVDLLPQQEAPSPRAATHGTQTTGKAPQQGPDQNELFNMYAKPAIAQANTKEDLARIWNDYKNLQGYPAFMTELTARRKALGIKNSKEK